MSLARLFQRVRALIRIVTDEVYGLWAQRRHFALCLKEAVLLSVENFRARWDDRARRGETLHERLKRFGELKVKR